MFQFDRLVPSIPFILEGTVVTLHYTLLSINAGLLLGYLIALMRLSDSLFVRGITTFYISIFRGTPLLVQLSLAYYAIPQLTGYKISPFGAIIISFSLNSSAYIAEIVRAGIQAVDKGQMEAGLSLGLGRIQVLKDIILPQALKNSLPALINEFISLLKESVIVSVIGEMDLMRRASLVAAEKYIYFEPLLLIAAVYYVLVMILTTLAKGIERRLRRSD